MRLAVAVKQVPAMGEGATDLEGGFLIRGGRQRLNPYDGPALEAALRLREAGGGGVEVFSMGPPGAREALAEALAMGADRAWLLTDPAFAGADSLATARTLAAGCRSRGAFDLYLCGLTTTDGDTGQVGPSLAVLLGLPFVGRVTGFEMAAGRLLFSQVHDGERQVVGLAPPAVISVVRESFVARLPSLKLKLLKKPVGILALKDLPEPDPDLYGLSGSPTRIKRVYQPKRPERGLVRRLTGTEAAAELKRALADLNGNGETA